MLKVHAALNKERKSKVRAHDNKTTHKSQY